MKIGAIINKSSTGLNIACKSLVDNKYIFPIQFPYESDFDYYLFAGQPLPVIRRWRRPIIIYFYWEFETLLPHQLDMLLYDKLIPLILVNTQWLKNVLTTHGVKENKIKIIPFNFFEVFNTHNIDINQKNRHQYFTFGRLHWRKGVPETVKYLKQLKDEEFKFLIYSGMFDDKKLFQEYINLIKYEADNDKRFIIKTANEFPQKTVDELKTKSWGGLFLSNAEGLGLLPFECIFSNTLCIMTELPTWKEMFPKDYPFFVKTEKTTFTNKWYSYFPMYPFHIADEKDFIYKFKKLNNLPEDEYKEILQKTQNHLLKKFPKNAKETAVNTIINSL